MHGGESSEPVSCTVVLLRARALRSVAGFTVYCYTALTSIRLSVCRKRWPDLPQLKGAVPIQKCWSIFGSFSLADTVQLIDGPIPKPPTWPLRIPQMREMSAMHRMGDCLLASRPPV